MRVEFGPVSRIEATSKDGKPKRSKPVKFAIAQDQTYNFTVRLAQRTVVVEIDERRAMSLELPPSITKLSELSFSSTHDDIEIYSMTIQGKMREPPAPSPQPNPPPKAR